ncbi:MAG: hypothetical protein A3K83_04285 [Omnitrophica WOR_2 bacterium RBG_13_44_8b]|nr:MAG: hypothetical protein A3K83_04285 [Omnitrophica WOR_2 bacterium RBG_13_44_8b]
MPEIVKGFMQRQTNELVKGKITMPQFFILNVLGKEGATKMTDIAHVLNVTTAAATGIIDRLVKYGYVERLYEPQDRRIIKVKLTKTGTQLLTRINQQKKQMIMDIFGRISQAERESYLKILTRIQDILTEPRA